MRLLNHDNDGTFSLTEFIGDDVPAYAILSHTWGIDGDEVTFKDLVEGTGNSKAGYKKLRFCGEQARRDNLQYFWVDTCCIDKSSSAELSEAINSMFRWYREAAKCYVYLSDVWTGGNNNGNQVPQPIWELAFRESRWFTRGWTLQELVAPPSLEFFSCDSRRLGNKTSLQRQISEITGIPIQALQGGSLSRFSVPERIKWAAKRETKRREDLAYSLLGIFEVHLPLIYGEGRENAFIRLQEEIDKRSKKNKQVPFFDEQAETNARHLTPKYPLSSFEPAEQVEINARNIATELSSSDPSSEMLIKLLPALSHDEILELRAEYKRVCKIQGRGVNMAKHLKVKTTGNFGKIAYLTALGRWESEGYWVNFWYQTNSTRRELLIEALLGRPNIEIRAIKDVFKDKRHNDDLVRCIDKEVKASKLRVTVLTALEEKRQEENEVWPVEEVNRDLDSLYNALQRGSETAILEIVVGRSDRHLRSVLLTYERKYGRSFAKDALRRSSNLVGEIIAHILNGVINRPARDALLLNHALLDLSPPEKDNDFPSPHVSKSNVSKSEQKRDGYEVFFSRLVRLHWDRQHFLRVKLEYHEKYGSYLEEDIENIVNGDDAREFCLVMCESAT